MDDSETPSVELAVVGASAGGVEALRGLVAALPHDLSCPLVVILHVAPSGTSVLPQILSRSGPLPAATASDGDELRPGHIYVAPPDCHILIDGNTVSLSGGPRENGHRPAIDPAMRTAAESYGTASCGIILSGTRDDGTAGLAAIKAAGGTVYVQDPSEALYPPMPNSAIANVAVDGIGRVADLGDWLVRAAGGTPSHRTSPEDAPTALRDVSFTGGGPTAIGTRFTCPDCGGVLWETLEDGVVQLRCSVGHVYSPESLASEHGRELERALWIALRTLEDRSELMQRMADRAAAADHGRSARSFERQAQQSRAHSALIRQSMDRFSEAPDVSSGEAELA